MEETKPKKNQSEHGTKKNEKHFFGALENQGFSTRSEGHRKGARTKKAEQHTTETKEHSPETQQPEEQQSIFSGSVVLVLAVLVALLFYNQLQLFELSALVGAGGMPSVSMPTFTGGTLSLSDGEKVTYAPVLLAPGEQPVLPGYGTKIKELPTISASATKPKTGDAVQDTLNKIVPIGTPEYGTEIGVSFDDPINAQRKLGALERSVTLNQAQEQRWLKITSSFTCDYCCGSPQRPTRITQCGCAHAAAWRGLAKHLISKYDSKVSDQQIMGELSKWKALWYPGPTVQRVIQEQTATGGKTDNSVNLDALPQMVGGC